MRVRDLNEVTEHAIVSNLQRADSRARALLGLQLRNGILAAGGNRAQIIEFAARELSVALTLVPAGDRASPAYRAVHPFGKLPAAMAQRMNEDVNKVLAMPDVQASLAQYGAEDGGGSAFSSSYANDLASEERLLLSAWESTLLLKDVTFAVCATDAEKLKWLQVPPGCLCFIL
jgi:hypothetical protein